MSLIIDRSDNRLPQCLLNHNWNHLSTDRSSILGDAIHASAWDKIQLKEAEMNRVPEQFAEERPQQPPVFTTHLQSYDRLTEQQSVHLEATVEPKTDPNLRVEWSKNGVPLMTG